jgi:hypothetical protein
MFWRCVASIIGVDVVNVQRLRSEGGNKHQPVCHSVSQWQRVALFQPSDVYSIASVYEQSVCKFTLI